MARPLRLLTPNAWHHVVNRGNRRERIFRTDDDRRRFLGCLSEFPLRFRIEVHAFVLMDNHYHLLIETPNGNAYPAYAGNAVAPAWLTREKLWLRVARAGDKAAAAYRKQIEDYLK
jgi:REP element-mobilizing transposase RayT